MCGIVGFISNTRRKEWHSRAKMLKEYMQEGLFFDTVRGGDATGIMRVNADSLKEPAMVYKKAVSGPDFLQLRQTDKILDSLDDAAFVVGHNRAGTSGSKDRDRNAHPFQYDHITLVHNGHINNVYSLGLKDAHPVDSAAVAEAFSKFGAREVLPKLNGAFVFVWHDAREGTLNIARNDARPLHWLALGDKPGDWEGMVFASEMEMLWLLVERNGIPHHGKFLYPSAHTWYKFDYEDLSKYTTEKFEPFKEVSRSNFTQGTVAPSTHGSTTTIPEATPRGLTTIDRHGLVTPINSANLPAHRRKALKRLSKQGIRYEESFMTRAAKFEPYKNQRTLGKLVMEIIHGKHQNREIDVDQVQRELAERLLRHGTQVGISCVDIRGHKKQLVGTLPQYLQKANDSPRAVTRAVVEETSPKRTQYVPGPNKQLIELTKFQELTKDGCAICQCDIFPSDSTDLEWRGEGSNSPICKDCSTEERAFRAIVH